MITNPGSTGPLDLTDYNVIIGNNVPVFTNNDIIFEANTPLYIENKITTVTNNSPLITGPTISKLVTNQ